MRTQTLCTALLALSLVLGAGLAAAEEESRPLFVKVHADWCGTCVRLNSTWDELQTRFGDRADFVILDVTEQADVSASSRSASELGITAFFNEHRAKTGTIGVLDADREPVAVLKGVRDPDPYAEAFEKALAASSS